MPNMKKEPIKIYSAYSRFSDSPILRSIECFGRFPFARFLFARFPFARCFHCSGRIEWDAF